MPITTSRADKPAQVVIDYSTCSDCAVCARVCKGGPLYVKDGRVRVDQRRYLGCIGCGHCMAVCPTGSITVSGRDLTPDDRIDPALLGGRRPDWEALNALMATRRSIRDYTDQPVSQRTLDEIIRAVSWAPMGLPPSDVKALVFGDAGKMRRFAGQIVGAMRRMRPMMSAPGLLCLKPFLPKEHYQLMKHFVAPASRVIIEKWEQGEDWLFYGAPAGIYFYGTLYSDPADSVIAATYAMLAAESMGLGSCLNGFVAPVLSRSKSLLRTYAIAPRHQPGLFIALGTPAVKFKNALKRRLARVDYV